MHGEVETEFHFVIECSKLKTCKISCMSFIMTYRDPIIMHLNSYEWQVFMIYSKVLKLMLVQLLQFIYNILRLTLPFVWYFFYIIHPHVHDTFMIMKLVVIKIWLDWYKVTAMCTECAMQALSNYAQKLSYYARLQCS